MQRKRPTTLVIALAILAVLVSASSVGPALAANSPVDLTTSLQTGPYLTASGAVYVRGGPGTGFFIVGTLYAGEVVPILGVSPDGGWWYVNSRFGEGWVSGAGATATFAENVAVRDPGPIGTVITAGAVNVRDGAGANAPVLGQLSQGAQVLVLARNADGSWLQVRWAQGTGWVSSRYVSTTGLPGVVSEAVPITSEAPFAIVTAIYLNVRSGPGPNYSILGQIYEGDIVPIVGRTADNSWYQVETATLGIGWVYGGYVTTRNEFGGSPVTTGTAVGAPQTGPLGIVNTGAANLRSGPGPQYSVLGVLAGGEETRIIGRSADWTWWLLETSQGNGWVDARLIAPRGDISAVPFAATGDTSAGLVDGQGGQAPPAQVQTIAVVTTGALNIRTGPNSVFDSLGAVYAKTRLPVIGQSPDRGWWLVESPYGNGWVSKSFVVVEGDTSNIPIVR